MQIQFTPSVTTKYNNSFNTKQQAPTVSNNINKNYSASHQAPVAFKGWFDDMVYYIPKKNEEIRDRKKELQIDKVENMVHDDVKFIAKRYDMPVEKAKQQFNATIQSVSLPLQKDGNEVGLNKVIGYSPEKYQAMKDLLVPLKFAKTDKAKDYPMPNGMILYGPSKTGKTHFAKALGEHAVKKFGYTDVQFTKFHPGKLTEEDNGIELMEFFDNAESDYKRNGRRNILFFDDIENFVNFDKNPEVAEVFLAMTDSCADRGVTWIATSSDPEKLPNSLFKPFRLNSDINIDKSTNSEKSAIMSYMWRQKDRLDETDHNKLLSEYKNKFNFYPAEIKYVADKADDYLATVVDQDSLIHTDYSYDKGYYPKKEKSSVKTELAEEYINDFIANNKSTKSNKSSNNQSGEQYSGDIKLKDDSEDKFVVYSKRYSQKDEKPFVNNDN